jgi:hypothetical protein
LLYICKIVSLPILHETFPQYFTLETKSKSTIYKLQRFFLNKKAFLHIQAFKHKPLGPLDARSLITHTDFGRSTSELHTASKTE